MTDPVYGVVAAFAARLAGLGVSEAVVSPGSRSTPLTLCLDAQPRLTTWMQIDERSAGFFALGLGRATGRPAVLVCTSGTAAANYLPAVVEAHHAGVPLIACTADRPPEMRGWGSPQTIDQVGLYGSAVRLAIDLPTPGEMTAAEAADLADRALAAATGADPGPVHLNWPLRKPLEPRHGVPTAGPPIAASRSRAVVRPRSDTAPAGSAPTGSAPGGAGPSARLDASLARLAEIVASNGRGVVIAGPWPGGGLGRERAWAAHTLRFAAWAGWPVIGEPISGVRRSLGDGVSASMGETCSAGEACVVATADHLLADESFADRMRPDAAVLVGRTVTTKTVRLWLERTRPAHVVQIDPENRWKQAVFRLTGNVPATVEALGSLTADAGALGALTADAGTLGALTADAGALRALTADAGTLEAPRSLAAEAGAPAAAASRNEARSAENLDAARSWLGKWRRADHAARRAISNAIGDGPLLSALLSRTLAAALPRDAVLLASNSLPVRDLDVFVTDTRSLSCVANRGASGIDGLVSTALGLAAAEPGRATALYAGDLALLHDLAGLTAAARLGLHLTVVCADNGGGGIFSLLPVADRIDAHDFERLFRTPHGVRLCDLDGFGGIRAGEAPGASELAEAVRAATAARAPGVDLIVVPVSCDDDLAQRRRLTAAAQSAARAAEGGL